MSLSRARLIATPWTVVYKASLSMEFSRQEYWSGLPFPDLMTERQQNGKAQDAVGIQISENGMKAGLNSIIKKNLLSINSSLIQFTDMYMSSVITSKLVFAICPFLIFTYRTHFKNILDPPSIVPAFHFLLLLSVFFFFFLLFAAF